jgi:hypothetical protein
MFTADGDLAHARSLSGSRRLVEIAVLGHLDHL